MVDPGTMAWLSLVCTHKDTQTYQGVTCETKCTGQLRYSNSCCVQCSDWGFGCWDRISQLVCPTQSTEPLKNSVTPADTWFTSKENSNTQRKSTPGPHMLVYEAVLVCVCLRAKEKPQRLPGWDLCDLTDKGPCDQRLLVNCCDWLGWKSENVPQSSGWDSFGFFFAAVGPQRRSFPLFILLPEWRE